jgi:hypothetical protein
MLSLTSSKVINFLFYQVGWFCCVLGAAKGYPISGSLVALVLLGIHLWLAESRQAEAKLMLYACLFGVLIDSFQQALGILTFKSDPYWPLWLPLWILVVWAQFATLFHYALYWLSQRYLLGALFGFIGGPLAYWGGVRLGAASFGDNLFFSLSFLALVWALVTPLLLWLSRRLDPHEGRYRKFFRT